MFPDENGISVPPYIYFKSVINYPIYKYQFKMKKNITLSNAILLVGFLSFTFFVSSCSKDDNDTAQPKSTYDSLSIMDLFASGYINGGDTTSAYVLVDLATG